MKKLIPFLILFAFASCKNDKPQNSPLGKRPKQANLKGKWKVAKVSAMLCKTDKEKRPVKCDTPFTVPGVISGCATDIDGTMEFDSETKGAMTWKFTVYVMCRGEKVDKSSTGWTAKFRIFKKDGKSLMHTKSKNFDLDREYLITGNTLTIVTEFYKKGKVQISTIALNK